MYIYIYILPISAYVGHIYIHTHRSPEFFGSFTKALFTLFQICTGYFLLFFLFSFSPFSHKISATFALVSFSLAISRNRCYMYIYMYIYIYVQATGGQVTWQGRCSSPRTSVPGEVRTH
jgi:hypothetical protein